MRKYSISRTGQDEYLYDVWYEIARVKGTGTADIIAYALQWYVNTGRASVAFLKSLFECPPGKIADLLCKGGTDAEKIARIKKHIDNMVAF